MIQDCHLFFDITQEFFKFHRLLTFFTIFSYNVIYNFLSSLKTEIDDIQKQIDFYFPVIDSEPTTDENGETYTNANGEKVGIVMQKAVLFKGTIRENLLWGRADATDEELMAAAKMAQAADFI